MGADKNKAKKGQWRIKENTLWLIGFIGGAIGLTIVCCRSACFDGDSSRSDQLFFI